MSIMDCGMGLRDPFAIKDHQSNRATTLTSTFSALVFLNTA